MYHRPMYDALIKTLLRNCIAESIPAEKNLLTRVLINLIGRREP
jgi:hypothetical protein